MIEAKCSISEDSLQQLLPPTSRVTFVVGEVSANSVFIVLTKMLGAKALASNAKVTLIHDQLLKESVGSAVYHSVWNEPNTRNYSLQIFTELKHRPYGLCVGDVSSVDVADAVINSVFTGHTVVCCIRGHDIQSGIERLLSLYPPQEREFKREDLLLTTHAVVCQVDGELLWSGPEAFGTSRLKPLE